MAGSGAQGAGRRVRRRNNCRDKHAIMECGRARDQLISEMTPACRTRDCGSGRTAATLDARHAWPLAPAEHVANESIRPALSVHLDSKEIFCPQRYVDDLSVFNGIEKPYRILALTQPDDGRG